MLDQSRNNFWYYISFRSATAEVVIPLFAGILCSLLLCTVISVSFGVFFDVNKDSQVVEIIAEAVNEEEDDAAELLLSETEKIDDTVLKYFRDPEYKEWVIGFFTGICSNREIALAILENAYKFNIPPSLAFALSWEESKFNPTAVSKYNRNGSVDRGLFQLNNFSFPNLDAGAFFDINTNAYYGLSHLRHCLDSGDNEISALAMYNAGTGKVRTTGAPEVTLNYISRILENRGKIEGQFNAKLIKEEENRLASVTPTEKTDNDPRFQFNRTLISASQL